ncbi:MAG: PAS domain-containing protein, partial [Methanogenium sp.]|nr:PAS domain-containing protein [Methanogenium sp.]
VKCSNDAIIGLNLDGTVISWNRAAEELFEYSANEILGKSILSIVPKGREKEIEIELENIKNDISIKNFETVRINKSGKKVDVSISLSPIKHDNKIFSASVITRDITKEKEMSGIMIGYISEAAMRLKNPVELVKNNLENMIEQIQSEEMGCEDVILQLKVQVKNNEQILHNLRELNQAIIGSFGEIPEEYVEFLLQ